MSRGSLIFSRTFEQTIRTDQIIFGEFTKEDQQLYCEEVEAVTGETAKAYLRLMVLANIEVDHEPFIQCVGLLSFDWEGTLNFFSLESPGTTAVVPASEDWRRIGTYSTEGLVVPV